MHDGPYALATVSDDGSSVFVDGRLVVDNGGARDWPRGATGSVTLTRGVHAIHIRYARESGPFHFELLWARAGEPLERIPGWAMAPRRAGFQAFAISAALRRALAAAEWIWVGALVLWVLTFGWRRLRSPEGVAAARRGVAGDAVGAGRVSAVEPRGDLVGAARRQLGAR